MSIIRRTIVATALVAVIVVSTAAPVSAGVIGNESAFTSTSLSLEMDRTSPATGWAFAISPRLGSFLLRIGLLR